MGVLKLGLFFDAQNQTRPAALGVHIFLSVLGLSERERTGGGGEATAQHSTVSPQYATQLSTNNRAVILNTTLDWPISDNCSWTGRHDCKKLE